MAIIDLKDCKLKIVIGVADTGESLDTETEFVMGEGSLTYTSTRNIEYRLANGLLAGSKVRKGDEVPMEVSFEGDWETVSSYSLKSDEDILGVLTATGQTSDDDDECMLDACDLVLTSTPATGCGEVAVYTFPDFRWESFGADAGAGTLSVSGKCKAEVPLIT